MNPILKRDEKTNKSRHSQALFKRGVLKNFAIFLQEKSGGEVSFN